LIILYRRLLKTISFFVIVNLYSAPSLAQTFNVYSYHIDPPFQLESDRVDLTADFITRLNQWQNKHVFKLQLISRPDLNQKLIDNEPYLILWANPLWFKSKDKHVMATEHIFWDADVWVSHRSRPVKYTQPSDLIGKHIGARRGYYYHGVTQLINNHKIQATRQVNDKLNADMLMKKKIDAFVMSRSSYLYWEARKKNTSDFYVSISPHDAYQRRILVSQSNQHLIPLLNSFISETKNNADWKQRMGEFGVNSLVEPMELELNELLEY
jgi:ABC-type amino acid transport substrate-binding protein